MKYPEGENFIMLIQGVVKTDASTEYINRPGAGKRLPLFYETRYKG